MVRGWLPAWALVAVTYGGASLIVPLYVVELGGGPFTLGVLFATGSLVGVPGALVIGSMADRSGRRRAFVLGAMVITTVAMATIPLLDAIVPVIVANAVIWLSFAAAVPVLNLLVVSDESAGRWTDAIAQLNEAQGIGWALGLGLGFVIVAVGEARYGTLGAQRGFFLACAGCAAVGTLLAVRRLPSDRAGGGHFGTVRLQRALLRAPRLNVRGAAFPITPGRVDPRALHPRRFVRGMAPPLRRFYLAVFLAFTGFGVFFAPLPAFLSETGVTDDGIFALYFSLNVAAAACFGFASLLAKRVPLPMGLAGGLALRGGLFVVILAAAGLVASGPGFVAVVGLFALLGGTWSIIAVTATTLVTHLASVESRGEALGWYGAIGAVGGGVGGLGGGALAESGYLFAFVAAGILVVLGGLVVGRVRGAERPIPRETAASTT